jgi:hypothetical protein
MNWRLLAVVGAVLGSTTTASAQPQLGPSPRPAFSPYLNLLRGNQSPALNYYGLVRPQIQARESILGLQNQVGANQEAIGGVQAGLTDLTATGHQTMFLNHGSYFLTQGGGVGAGGRANTGGTFSTGVGKGTGGAGAGGGARGGRSASPRRR